MRLFSPPKVAFGNTKFHPAFYLEQAESTACSFFYCEYGIAYMMAMTWCYIVFIYDFTCVLWSRVEGK